MASDIRIAAQLYIYGESLHQPCGLPPILAGLAEAGYDAVEGFGGVPSNPNLLQTAKLGYVGPHLVLPALSDPDTVAAETKRLGGEAVICSGLREWDVRTPAAYRGAAEMLNAAGRTLRASGVRLHYHNHDFEFDQVDGTQTGMDLLCAGLDPNAVELCVDAGWVWRAGQDPSAFLREHRNQIGLVHLRDFIGTQSVPLGRGEIPLAPIIAALSDLPNLHWAIVEQDPDSTDPGADMAVSRVHLRERFSL